MSLLAVQGTLQSLLQYHSLKESILRGSAFFIVQLSHPYLTTGKTIALTRRTFVGKVMPLLFNVLSSLVIAFLPRSKGLLISWQRSPSIVILEPKKISLLHIHVNFSCLSLPVPLPLSLQFSDTVGVSFPISVLKVERKVKVKVKSLSRVQIL